MSFFVYIDETVDGRPFYVGKGTKTRVGQRDRNKHWKRIMSKHGWRRRIAGEFDTEAEAHELEVALIRLHGTFERDPEFGVWGANHSLGGEGNSGFTFRHFEAAKEKICASLIGRPGHMLGKKQTSEARAKIGAVHRGRRQHASQVAKRSGENNASAKLTWDQVRAIRASTASQRALAVQYGVSHTLIGYIKRGLLWK